MGNSSIFYGYRSDKPCSLCSCVQCFDTVKLLWSWPLGARSLARECVLTGQWVGSGETSVKNTVDCLSQSFSNVEDKLLGRHSGSHFTSSWEDSWRHVSQSCLMRDLWCECSAEVTVRGSHLGGSCPGPWQVLVWWAPFSFLRASHSHSHYQCLCQENLFSLQFCMNSVVGSAVVWNITSVRAGHCGHLWAAVFWTPKWPQLRSDLKSSTIWFHAVELLDKKL